MDKRQTQKWNNDIGDIEAYGMKYIQNERGKQNLRLKAKSKSRAREYALEHNDPDFEEWNGKNWHCYIRCFQEIGALEIGDLCSRKSGIRHIFHI